MASAQWGMFQGTPQQKACPASSSRCGEFNPRYCCREVGGCEGKAAASPGCRVKNEDELSRKETTRVRIDVQLRSKKNLPLLAVLFRLRDIIVDAKQTVTRCGTIWRSVGHGDWRLATGGTWARQRWTDRLFIYNGSSGELALRMASYHHMV